MCHQHRDVAGSNSSREDTVDVTVAHMITI